MEAVTAEPGRLRVFEALRHRDFRLLWSGQAVSLLGDMAFLTALGWKAFTLAGSSRLGVVLLGLAAGELATLLVGGALADRYERRRMMIVSDVSRFAAVGALAAVDASGHLTFPDPRRARGRRRARRRLLLSGGRRDRPARRG